ncbi:MAG: hypothetical protein AAB353_05320, partial [Candidatus Hydrogenedentota bacterium]
MTVFTAVSHAQFPPPDFAVSGDPELEKIQTELYRGIREGRVDAVERFVKLGGNLNVGGIKRDPPLLEAIRFNRPDMVRAMFEHGARLYTSGDARNLALHHAAL